MTTNEATEQYTQMFSPQEVWLMVAGQLKAQMDRYTYENYVRDASAVDGEDGFFTIAAPTAQARDWLASRLTSTVQRQLAPLVGQPVQVRFIYPAVVNPVRPIKTDHRGDDAPQLAPDRQIIQPEADAAGGQAQPAGPPAAVAPDSRSMEEEPCQRVLIESISDTVDAALKQTGRIAAFPRYELRHIPFVGPEAFFLRLAFLQERYLKTPPEGRGATFETTVDALLRWANVGRATLHRFKKGDPGRGQQPAAGWFGIEQMPSAPRSAGSQQQPPCRYRLQQGIPLTPMDADRLRSLLLEAGIRSDPLQALQDLCRRPAQEILGHPMPSPTEEQKKRAPVFTTVASVVVAALAGVRIPPSLRPQIEEWTAKLSDLVTTPNQMVFVSWYFLEHWLPLLGHDAAALVIYARAQGYYNPQDQELRDVFPVAGGYSELARVIGLKRDRTIGDWLPNIFDRQAETGGDSERWQRQQERQQQVQAMIGQFVQVVPGSRRKSDAGHYAFQLRVELKSDPLTPSDSALRDWVHSTLARCQDAGVLTLFHAWVTSPVIAERAIAAGENQNDGAGILGLAAEICQQNDGWGILAASQHRSEMTAGESGMQHMDGWGILGELLDDGAGILAGSKMTAGELFKGLLRLNTFWESILNQITTTQSQAQEKEVVVPTLDLRLISQRNGGMNRIREQVLARETSVEPFLSWLFYAYSFKGRGIDDPVGFAFARLREQSGAPAEGVFRLLAALPPETMARLLQNHIESGSPPMDSNWRMAFQNTPAPRLRELADTLGLVG